MSEVTVGVGQTSVDVTVPIHIVEVTVPTHVIDVVIGGAGGGGGGGSTDVYAQTGPPPLGSTDLIWVDIDDTSGGGGGGGSVDVYVQTEPPALGSTDLLWVDIDNTSSGGGGGGGTGVTDHGALTGLNDPDHPISAIQGLQVALNGKANVSHAHALADLPTTLATETEVLNAITTHSGLADPHPNYLLPAEVVAGTNVTITRPGDGTVSIASTASGGGGGYLGVWNSSTTYPAGSTVYHQDGEWGTVAGAAAGMTPLDPGVTIPNGADMFASAAIIQVPGDGMSGSSALFANNSFGTEAGEPNSGMPRTAWFKYTPITSGSMQFDTIGSTGDTMLYLYTGPASGATFASLTQIAYNDNSGGGGTSLITQTVTANTTYYIQICSGSGGTMDYRLNLVGARSTGAATNPWTRLSVDKSHTHTGTYWGLWSGAQTAYNAIGTKDPNVLYCVTGP